MLMPPPTLVWYGFEVFLLWRGKCRFGTLQEAFESDENVAVVFGWVLGRLLVVKWCKKPPKSTPPKAKQTPKYMKNTPSSVRSLVEPFFEFRGAVLPWAHLREPTFYHGKTGVRVHYDLSRSNAILDPQGYQKVSKMHSKWYKNLPKMIPRVVPKIARPQNSIWELK